MLKRNFYELLMFHGSGCAGFRQSSVPLGGFFVFKKCVRAHFKIKAKAGYRGAYWEALRGPANMCDWWHGARYLRGTGIWTAEGLISGRQVAKGNALSNL